jgi:hypothetical protein
MKKFLISTVSAVAFAGAAMATPFEEVDVDGDGEVSLEELQAVDPNVTEAEFTLYDTDLSGALDEEQYDAWRVATQGEGEAVDPMTEEPAYEEPTDEFSEEPIDEFSEEPAYEDPLDEPAYEEPGISIQEDDPWSDDEWEDDESSDEEEDEDEDDEAEDEEEPTDPYADPMK